MCKNKQLSKNTGDKIVDLHKAWMASEKMKIDFTAITWKWKLHKKTISCSQSGVQINILAHGTRMIMKYVAELQRRSLLMIWRQLGPQSPRTPLVTHYAVMDRNLANVQARLLTSKLFREGLGETAMVRWNLKALASSWVFGGREMMNIITKLKRRCVNVMVSGCFFLSVQDAFAALKANGRGREPASVSQNTEDGSWVGLPARQSPKIYCQGNKEVVKEEPH